MQISWHGQYTIKIQSQETTLVLDPYSPETGLTPFRAKAEIVALSNPGDATMSHVAAIQGEPFIIKNAGEYSFTNFVLHGLGWHDGSPVERTLQRWMIEDLTLFHVGALNREMTAEELQELEKTDIDVLFVPVGGGAGLTTAQALKLVSTIEPRVIIPIHYELPKLTEKLTDVTQFAKEMGIDPKVREKKLILKKNKLPQEDVMTVLLEA